MMIQSDHDNDAPDEPQAPNGAPRQRHRVAAILIVFSIVAITSYLALDVWLMTRRAVQPSAQPQAETSAPSPER